MEAKEQSGLELRPGLNKVTFQSDGSTLVGNLFLPHTYQDGSQIPGVVVAGSWTTVKEQMAGGYARRLAAEGFAALAFDFRHYGESEGAPRNFEDPDAKIDDLKSAAAFLASLPVVDGDAIGGLGVCAGAGYLAAAVSQDDRFKAFATVAAWMQTPDAAHMFYGGEEGVQRRIEQADAARERFEQSGETDVVPAYEPGNEDAAMFFEVDYYGDPERGAIPAWPNEFATQGWRGWLTFDALAAAPNVAVPALFVHSDDAALPDFVRQFHEAVPGTKALHWTEGGQTDFYDQQPQVEEAVGAVAGWFRTHLASASLALLLSALAISPAAAGQVADTADKVAVSDTITRMLHAIDVLDREGVLATMTSEIQTDYRSLFGGEVQTTSADDLINGWWSVLPGFDRTQHLTGPIVADVDGDRAAARCAVTATHALGDGRWVVGGHYQMSLTKVDGVWLIDSITLETAFVDGNTGLPEKAGARVTDGAGR